MKEIDTDKVLNQKPCPQGNFFITSDNYHFVGEELKELPSTLSRFSGICSECIERVKSYLQEKKMIGKNSHSFLAQFYIKFRTELTNFDGFYNNHTNQLVVFMKYFQGGEVVTCFDNIERMKTTIINKLFQMCFTDANVELRDDAYRPEKVQTGVCEKEILGQVYASEERRRKMSYLNEILIQCVTEDCLKIETPAYFSEVVRARIQKVKSLIPIDEILKALSDHFAGNVLKKIQNGERA